MFQLNILNTCLIKVRELEHTRERFMKAATKMAN